MTNYIQYTKCGTKCQRRDEDVILLFKGPQFSILLAMWLGQRLLQKAIQVNLSFPSCGKSNYIL